jgi:hypothetical protein
LHNKKKRKRKEKKRMKIFISFKKTLILDVKRLTTIKTVKQQIKDKGGYIYRKSKFVLYL